MNFDCCIPDHAGLQIAAIIIIKTVYQFKFQNQTGIQLFKTTSYDYSIAKNVTSILFL